MPIDNVNQTIFRTTITVGQGPTGPSGPPGATGAVGPQGPAGLDGPPGPAGAAGPQGATGSLGPTGPAGATGPQGSTGPQGPVGPAGPQGAIGPQGPMGDVGPEGAEGPSGPQGATGPQGLTGPQGPIGATGPQGTSGAQGPTGPIGLTGPAGPQGAQGLQGDPGPSDWNAIPNKPSTFPPSSHSHAFADITGKPTTLSGYGITDGVATVNSNGTLNVATSGSTRTVTLNLASVNTWTGIQTFNEAIVKSLRLTSAVISSGRTLLASESIVILDPPVLEYFDCSTLTDQSSCQAESVCSWESWDCTQYSSEGSCNSDSYCSWSEMSCPEFGDESSCTSYSECSWNSDDSICEGGPIPSTGACNGGSGEQCSGSALDDGPATLGLPTSPSEGKNYWLRNAGSNSESVYVKQSGTTLFTINPFEGMHIAYAGGNWYGLSRGTIP